MNISMNASSWSVNTLSLPLLFFVADPRQEEHLGRSSLCMQHVYGVKILKNRRQTDGLLHALRSIVPSQTVWSCGMQWMQMLWISIRCTSTTGCPKVPWNSNEVLFSAKYERILKPFGLQIATLGRFDIMYDIPWLPIRCHLLWRITSWAYFWHWQLCGLSDIYYIWFFHPHNCLYSTFCMQNAHKCHLESWNIVESDKEAR